MVIALPHLNLDWSFTVFDSRIPIEISHICVSASYGISEQDRKNLIEGQTPLSLNRSHKFQGHFRHPS